MKKPTTVFILAMIISTGLYANKTSDTPSELAQKFTNGLQKMINQNGGSAKLSSGMYLITALRYNSTVITRVDIDTEEIINDILKNDKKSTRKGLKKLMYSKEYKDQTIKLQKNSFLSNYCEQNTSLRQMIDKGMIISINMTMDGYKSLISDFLITKKKCFDWKKTNR